MDIKDFKIHAGDVLLVQGNWENIMRLSKNQTDWVTLGQPVEEASKVTLDYKALFSSSNNAFNGNHDGIRFYSDPGVAAVIIAAILMVTYGMFSKMWKTRIKPSIGKAWYDCSNATMSLALSKTGVSSFISSS
jgi:hypothetical protein